MVWQRIDLVSPPADCLLHVAISGDSRLFYGWRIRDDKNSKDVLYTSLFSDDWTYASQYAMRALKKGHPVLQWQIVDIPIELDDVYSVENHTPTQRKKGGRYAH